MGFVALHHHGKGHFKSNKLIFVMHNSVTKSKRKMTVLVHSILLKWPRIHWPEVEFFFLCLSCFTRVFCPETFVECSMTNVLVLAFHPKATSSVLDTKDNMFPKVFWTYAPGPFSSLFIARAIKVLNSHAKCHQTPPVPFQKWYLHSC